MPKKTKTEETPQVQEVSVDEEVSSEVSSSVTETALEIANLANVPTNALANIKSKEMVEKLSLLVKKFSPNKRGLHMAESSGLASNFKPQIIKIRQPSTSAAPDSVNPGELFTSMNEPLGTNFQFSPLSFWKERVKWPEGATVSDQPECKSVDGVRGFWRQAEWLACDRCPYSKWDPKGGVNGQGGYPCKESVNVLGMDADIKDFYRIQFHGSNVKIGRKFHSIIKNRSEIFDAVWKISTQKHPKAPTFQYKVPEKVRDVAADEDVFHVNDFFIDVIEKVREEMKDRQDFYINQAGDMAADAPDDVGTVDSSEAAPDFNM